MGALFVFRIFFNNAPLPAHILLTRGCQRCKLRLAFKQLHQIVAEHAHEDHDQRDGQQYPISQVAACKCTCSGMLTHLSRSSDCFMFENLSQLVELLGW